jgi:Glu-tRNA(Gln) amidotransferase subunit E-like FAD-binding protein
VTVSDTLGGADYPSPQMWDQPWKLLMQARDLNKGGGNIVAASKRLAQAALLTDVASIRLDEYIEATVKGASRAAFAAKVVYEAAGLFESALMIFSLAAIAGEYVAMRVATRAAEKAAEAAAKKKIRKEFTREMFDKMLATGKSTFRRSAATEDLRGLWLEDINRIVEAVRRVKGRELTEQELERLFEAAQAKWFGR